MGGANRPRAGSVNDRAPVIGQGRRIRMGDVGGPDEDGFVFRGAPEDVDHGVEEAGPVYVRQRKIASHPFGPNEAVAAVNRDGRPMGERLRFSAGDLATSRWLIMATRMEAKPVALRRDGRARARGPSFAESGLAVASGGLNIGKWPPGTRRVFQTSNKRISWRRRGV